MLRKFNVVLGVVLKQTAEIQCACAWVFQTKGSKGGFQNLVEQVVSNCALM